MSGCPSILAHCQQAYLAHRRVLDSSFSSLLTYAFGRCGIRQRRGYCLAIIVAAHKALNAYLEQSQKEGKPLNVTVFGAVCLTLEQQTAVSAALTAYWCRDYRCPKILDIKPRHGYESRVLKDGFSGEQYVEWLVAGCSDVAVVSCDGQGRPRLVVRCVQDQHPAVYDIVVPINSDAHGKVHISGMIPSGLEPRQKKTAPSAVL